MNVSQTLSSLLKKDKIWIIVITTALVILAFTNIFVNPAIDFLSKVNSDMMLGLGAAMELKSIATNVDNSNIPLLGGLATELEGIFSRAVNYLTFANIVIGVQTILVNIGKSVLFKVLPLIFLAGIFIEKYKRLALKLLIVALLINPGLSLYVNGIHYVSDTMELDLGSKLHEHLSAIKNKYNKKREKITTQQEARKKRQLEKARKKGHKDISIVKKVEDAVVNKVEDIGVGVEEGFSEAFEILKEGKKELMKLIINMASNLVVLFLILPLLYFYIMSFVFKKFFHFSSLSAIETAEVKNLKNLGNDFKSDIK
ncbi:hypothetical protein U6A24_08355 [Aquimarina gracilis]|uniref:Uncharacterized protein n=1 Tax=Aquimarina gracilis TaxID=874422 RepID=A0ABU5ZVF5_9FLAO|nr:hypothetical protein [Aquimarina gracilis]MEB3345466.1 hypothetical protein [Aquimarina gracilis]